MTSNQLIKSPLARALAALDGDRDAEAIEALVDAWRVRRSPALAELIDVLDARQPVRPFASLIRKAHAKETIARLRAARADDPRLSTVLIGILQQPVFATEQRLFWKVVIDLCTPLADPRLLPLATPIRQVLFVKLSPVTLRLDTLGRFNTLIRRISPALPTTADDAALEAQIAMRVTGPRTANRREADVLDEIYDDPLADAPRLVYADLLLERGDPRGEFIALQFKRCDHGLDVNEAERERVLLAKHVKTWLGGLANVVATSPTYDHRTTFERGFVATVGFPTTGAPRLLATTWAAREWSTVEEVVGPYAGHILEHAPLRGLRRIRSGAYVDILAVLAKRPECFVHVDAIDLPLTMSMSESDRMHLHACSGLPGLRRAAVRTQPGTETEALALLAAPIAARLERLVIVPDDPTRVDALAAAVGKRAGTVPRVHIQLRRLQQPVIELVRSADGSYRP